MGYHFEVLLGVLDVHQSQTIPNYVKRDKPDIAPDRSWGYQEHYY
jgi:hypothetical protein